MTYNVLMGTLNPTHSLTHTILCWEWNSKEVADGFFFATGHSAIAALQ